VAAAFHKATEPLLLAADANRKQSTTLAVMRDALLPKLLSGEVRVDVATDLANGEAAAKLKGKRIVHAD
jgi:hypothetical protein